MKHTQKNNADFVSPALLAHVFFFPSSCLLSWSPSVYSPLSSKLSVSIHPLRAILPVPSGHSQPVWPGLPLAVPPRWISSCLDLG